MKPIFPNVSGGGPKHFSFQLYSGTAEADFGSFSGSSVNAKQELPDSLEKNRLWPNPETR
ncbi:hypothetical protein [Synechococcus sp. R60.4]|uniref:hypothetical protein n=1 Tax=unclassified Synechococcus TaxID=2626047 RepID=UPI0039C38ACD